MDKVPTIFQRDPTNMSRVTPEPHPGAAWVFAGEGHPTRKLDGTNVRVDVAGGVVVAFWKRRNPTREAKLAGAEPSYVSASRDDPADRHLFAALDVTDTAQWPDGQWPCEALGPKIQGGRESAMPRLYAFSLFPEILPEFPRTVNGIRAFLEEHPMEGVVWHHPDRQRFGKIKARDLSIPYPP